MKLWILLLSSAVVVSSLKILVLSPKFGTSHVSFLAKVADLLSDAGHDVTVYSHNLHPGVKDAMTKKAKQINVESGIRLDFKKQQDNFWKRGFVSDYEIVSSIVDPAIAFSEMLYRDKAFPKWIREQNFDIAITEIAFIYEPIVRSAGVEKFVGVLTTNPMELVTDLFGISTNPSYVPGNQCDYTSHMSFVERFFNFVKIEFQKILVEALVLKKIERIVIKHLGDDAAPGGPLNALTVVKKNFAHLFVNNDEVLDFSRPTSSQWHYIGGLGRVKPKPLTRRFANIYRSSERGVVLMSFGTMARSVDMPIDVKRSFLKAFDHFPDITFIWKYESDDVAFATNATNVVMEKWIPQVDALNDRRTLAFIQHGGMGGVFESVFAGKPSLVVPLFADQLRNSKMLEAKGVARTIDKTMVTAERIVNELKDVLKPEYSQAARELSRLLQSKPFSPEDVLVKHVEYAATHNLTKHLRNPVSELSVVRYYMLDIFIPIVSVFSLSLLAVIYLTAKFALRVYIMLTPTSAQKRPKIE